MRDKSLIYGVNLLPLSGVLFAFLITLMISERIMIKFAKAIFVFIFLPFCIAADELPKRYGPFFYSESVGNALFLFGEIETANDLHLRKALREHSGIDTLVLDSPGGSVLGGLRLSEIVIDKNLSTYVPSVGLSGNGLCASACSFIFLSGKSRRADGMLGVHQFYSSDSEKLGKIGDVQGGAQEIVSRILQTLSDSKVPQFVFSKMFEYKRMYYFNQQELNEIEIVGPSLSSNFRNKANDFVNKFSRQIKSAAKTVTPKTITPKTVLPKANPTKPVKPAKIIPKVKPNVKQPLVPRSVDKFTLTDEQLRKAKKGCNDWYNGKGNDRKFWGSAPVYAIDYCAKKHGVNFKTAAGNRPLQIAAMYESPREENILHLINLGADMNLKNRYGVSAFFYLLGRMRNAEFIKLMIHNGADITLKTNKGLTAVDLLKKNQSLKNNKELLRLLRQ